MKKDVDSVIGFATKFYIENGFPASLAEIASAANVSVYVARSALKSAVERGEFTLRGGKYIPVGVESKRHNTHSLRVSWEYDHDPLPRGAWCMVAEECVDGVWCITNSTRYCADYYAAVGQKMAEVGAARVEYFFSEDSDIDAQLMPYVAIVFPI